MMTSSPGSSLAIIALYSICLAPAPAVTSSGAKSSPFSRANLSRMARFSRGEPSRLVYFVSPRQIAAIAASLMWSRVSKSGSPAPSVMTGHPSRFRAAARAVIARI